MSTTNDRSEASPSGGCTAAGWDALARSLVPEPRCYQARAAIGGVFVVEKILAERDGLFLVKWSGYPVCEATWEPEANILKRSLIDNYRKRAATGNVCRSQAAPDDDNYDFCMHPQCKADPAAELLVCETCPRAFHPVCIGLGAVPEGDFSCDVCASSADDPNFLVAAFDAQFAARKNNADVIGACRAAVEAMHAHDFGRVFDLPKNFPGYYAVVTDPMDFPSILSRLDAGEHSSGDSTAALDGVVRDVELVWANCRLFNRIGTALCRMATVLETMFATLVDTRLQALTGGGRPLKRKRDDRAGELQVEANEDDAALAASMQAGFDDEAVAAGLLF
jgi:hypothetical protein